MDKTDIFKQAVAELDEEQNRAAIDAVKLKILESQKLKKWWHKFVPFKLTITISRR